MAIDDQLSPVLVERNVAALPAPGTGIALLHVVMVRGAVRLESKPYVMHQLWMQADGDYKKSMVLRAQALPHIGGCASQSSGIAVGKSGNIILRTNNNIMVLSSDTGSTIRKFCCVFERYANVIHKVGVTVDRDGHIWVFTHIYKIQERRYINPLTAFTEEGTLVHETYLDESSEPVGIASDSQGRVVVFASDNKLLFYNRGELERVTKLDIDPYYVCKFHICPKTGEMYVLSVGNISKIISFFGNGDYKCTYHMIPHYVHNMTLVGDGVHMLTCEHKEDDNHTITLRSNVIVREHEFAAPCFPDNMVLLPHGRIAMNIATTGQIIIFDFLK